MIRQNTEKTSEIKLFLMYMDIIFNLLLITLPLWSVDLLRHKIMSDMFINSKVYSEIWPDEDKKDLRSKDNMRGYQNTLESIIITSMMSKNIAS